MVDKLCERATDQKIAIACFYCDFQSQNLQTPENVLGALVKQIVRGLGAMPTEIDEAFRKAKGQVGGLGLRVPDVLSLLKASIAPLDQAFICIDALDELLVKHLPTLLRSLHDISQSCPSVRFLLTGRPHIGVEIEKYFPMAARFLQMNGARQDIMRYIEMMLDDDPNPEAMNDGLRAEIMNRVSETISDVYAAAIFSPWLKVSLTVGPRFLLVSLNITAILDETTIYDRREQLKRMTSGRGLNEAYGLALERIKRQTVGKSKLGMAALMWISRSERPMSPEELCDALGVQIGSTDYNLDSIPSMQTLLASCLGLVTVDQEESEVRLAHFTLQEYLDNSSQIFQNSYAAMAQACLVYLNFDCIKRLPPTKKTDTQKYPFLRYASSYWGHYARNGTTESVKSLALHLLDGFDSHISTIFLLELNDVGRKYQDMFSFQGFTGLHCVAFLGVDEIAEALLDTRDWDFDRVDSGGCTPLILASIQGCEGIIRLLLEKTGASLNIRETMHGRTPLSWAAGCGKEGAVKLLLRRGGVNPESPDDDGRTPLSHAASFGGEGTVKLLLEQEEVNPESRDNSGRTPLSHAASAYRGRGAVKLLLGRREVNPESRDNSGRTPLSHAAESGSEKKVKLLLKREGVNPESRDNSGRTPLSHAMAGGWQGEGAVKLLLKREEVNPESRDNSGRTPLSHAASAFWTLELVELLLERGEVNPESRDNSGRTPLSHAAGSVRESTVWVLLEREGVNPESRDDSGRTPLSHAASAYGGGGIAELLLELEKANPESRDNSGRTPLSHAAGADEGESVVKLLLEREEVNPESQDNSGRTPRSYAQGGALELLSKHCLS